MKTNLIALVFLSICRVYIIYAIYIQCVVVLFHQQYISQKYVRLIKTKCRYTDTVPSISDVRAVDTAYLSILFHFL